MKFTITIKTVGLNIESETDTFDDIEPLINANTSLALKLLSIFFSF